METKRTHSPLAILSGAKPTDEIGFAALSLESNSDGWYQLLPAGHFKAIDGRPFDVNGGQWFLDESTAQSLIADLKSRVNHTVIDYEHQTLLADQNGQPAPASGWIKDAEWRETGLWIKADWTSRAAEYISGGEYCYLSAVFPYDKQTGKPLSLHSAALVNRPGLDGLNAVALRSLHFTHSDTPDYTEDSPMDRAQLIALLGLAEDATDADIESAIKALQKDKDDATSEVAALKAKTPTDSVDLAKYVPIQVVTDMQSELAALSAQVQTGGLEKLIEDAKGDGRLIPSMESWARDLGKDNFAALKTFLDSAKPVAALSAMQAGAETPPKDQSKDDELTSDELAVLKASGLTKEEYLAARAK